jgi:hypothetical protein
MARAERVVVVVVVVAEERVRAVERVHARG